jgi:hypothetical protein
MVARNGDHPWKTEAEDEEDMTMESHEVLTHFRGKEKYNCAQAILKAYSRMTGVGDLCLARFKQCGGGRTPTGECGALYAAKQMVEDPQGRRQLEDRFVEAAGSTQCREIRRARQFSCHQCVETVADQLLNHIVDGGALQMPSSCAPDGACPVVSG